MDNNDTLTFAYVRSKKATPLNLAITIVSILCVISVSFLCSAALYSSGLGMFSRTLSTTTYYALSVKTCATQSDAVQLSSQIMDKGGAGYIYLTTGYDVLVNIYLLRRDAQQIKTGLIPDYPDVSVIPISISKPTKKYPATQQLQSWIATSYELMTRVDIITEAETLSSVNLLRQQLSKIKYEEVPNVDKVKLLTVFSRLDHNMSSITNSGLKSARLSSMVKYQLIQSVFEYQALTRLL